MRRILELEKKVEVLEAGIDSVSELIESSQGVIGLHMNGDIATWEELQTGGRFEEWLVEFDNAIAVARGK
jgi:hypothetical protein